MGVLVVATPLVTLADWNGPPPSVDDWMDGRARILHYGATAADRVTVITVSKQPAQQLSATDGIAATSATDAMLAAVTAAVDIVFRADGVETGMDRQQAKEILSAPDEQLDWRPLVLYLDGEPRPGFQAVIDGAVALYAETEHNGVFIGLAATSSVPVEELAMDLASS